MQQHEPTEVDIIVGANIRQRRIAAGFTQAGLGAMLSEPVSSQQISKYELGEDQVGANMLVALGGVLKCSLTDLFDGVAATKRKIDDRHTVAAMGHYVGLPRAVQESLRELMRALAIELGHTMNVENVLYHD